MATAIRDLLAWYRQEKLPQYAEELAERLLPAEPGVIDPLHNERLAEVVFEWTGLAPSEFKRLDAGGKVVWLERALNAYSGGDL
jgi:hypothetical protein